MLTFHPIYQGNQCRWSMVNYNGRIYSLNCRFASPRPRKETISDCECSFQKWSDQNVYVHTRKLPPLQRLARGQIIHGEEHCAVPVILHADPRRVYESGEKENAIIQGKEGARNPLSMVPNVTEYVLCRLISTMKTVVCRSIKENACCLLAITKLPVLFRVDSLATLNFGIFR